MHQVTGKPLTVDEVQALDACRRVADHRPVGQISLQRNASLTEQLSAEHVQPRLLSHWGTGSELKRIRCPGYILAHGDDLPEVRDQHWISPEGTSS